MEYSSRSQKTTASYEQGHWRSWIYDSFIEEEEEEYKEKKGGLGQGEEKGSTVPTTCITKVSKLGEKNGKKSTKFRFSNFDLLILVAYYCLP